MQTKSLHTQLNGAEPQGSAMERAKFTPHPPGLQAAVIWLFLRFDATIYFWHVPIPCGGFGACFCYVNTFILTN